MTPLDQLLERKFRAANTALDTVSTDVGAAFGSTQSAHTLETLVAAVQGTTEPTVPATATQQPAQAEQPKQPEQFEEAVTCKVPATEVARDVLQVPVQDRGALGFPTGLGLATAGLGVATASLATPGDRTTDAVTLHVPAEDTAEESSNGTAETAEAEPPIAVKMPLEVADFQADWEIDRFPWPAICGEVEERVEGELIAATERIKLECMAHGSNAIVVTSARAGAGRTTMTLCLAREAARSGQKVAIIDLDHAQPNMLKRMGIDFEKGIESIHDEDVTMRDICLVAVEDGVSLVPAVGPFNPTQCTSEEMQGLLRSVAAHHDLVLIDASREVADVLAESKAGPSIGVIMVKDPDSQAATQAFVEWLHEKEAWTLGVIENFAA